VERDILGDFNSFLVNKVLVVINELNGKVGFKYSDDLKFHITSDTADIRKMRTDVKANTESFVRYMFFTNNEFPLKVDSGDRRYLVIQTSQPIPDDAYFKRLVKVIKKPSVLQRLFVMWKERDVSTVDWRNDRPLTEYMLDLREISREKELSFLIMKVKEWHADERKEMEVSGKDLFEQFRTDLQQNGCDWVTNNQKFGYKIKNYRIGGFSKGKNNRGVLYTFQITECIRWLIKETYLPADYLSLPEAPRKLLREEANPGCTHLPPM
jgi:hypothetical protein